MQSSAIKLCERIETWSSVGRLCQSAENFEVILSLDKAGEVAGDEDGMSCSGPHLDLVFRLVVMVVQQYKIVRLGVAQMLSQYLNQRSNLL